MDRAGSQEGLQVAREIAGGAVIRRDHEDGSLWRAVVSPDQGGEQIRPHRRRHVCVDRPVLRRGQGLAKGTEALAVVRYLE
jgi:hypothetical protein